MLNSATSNKLHFQNPKLKKQYSVITSFVSSGSPQQSALFFVTFYPSSIGRSALALTNKQRCLLSVPGHLLKPILPFGCVPASLYTMEGSSGQY